VMEANKVTAPSWLETVVDSEAGPLLLAGEKDGRRVVVLTFDPRESNLPKLAAFPLLMANVADWLYPLSSMQAVPPGSTLRLPVGSVVQTPDGRSVETGSAGLFVDTDEGGIYKVAGQGQPASSKPSESAEFAVNVADNGSATTAGTTHPELDHPQEGTWSEQSHSEIWFALAGFALALLVTEWLVYCWKRGSV
jgi:Ca-activated chloride channel homolog